MSNITNPLVVNICGCPGSGKSRMAHGIMWKLKIDTDCEFASEYAKDLVYSEDFKTLKNQIYVFGHQLQRIKRLYGNTQVVITDSPLLQSIVYNNSSTDKFSKLILEEHESFNNLNILMERKHKFNQNGRIHDEIGSNALHEQIVNMLTTNNIEYHVFSSDEESLDKIIELIKSKL